MMPFPKRLVVTSLLALSPALSIAAKKEPPKPAAHSAVITPDAAAFLNSAIDLMQQHALHAQSVDWTTLRQEAFKRAGSAFNPIDTYPAIYWALVRLNDPASHLKLPAGLYPDQISLLEQAQKEAANSADAAPAKAESAPTPFASRQIPEGHIDKIQGRNFAHVILPRCTARDNDGMMLYASSVRRILTDLSAQAPKGWIVDLRGNTGGNMWPMLTGIGPVLGEGNVGSFVGAGGAVTWFYQDGKSGTRTPAGLETVSLNLPDQPLRLTPAAPVAVLIDSSTTSSAEALTIAFHGRPNTRLFGEHTSGESTAVQPFKLDDGAEIFLTTAIDADRTGKPFPDGVTPDQMLPSVSSLPQESADTVVAAADTWLVTSTPAPPVKSKRKRKHVTAAAVHQSGETKGN